MEWETVIGLEIHTQLKTKSKIFSGAATAYGAEPNTQASAVDLALPGVLPVMNRDAARMAVKFGLAIGAKINQTSIFDRKNYFYPDLPKGYQISQLQLPIVGEGSITIDVNGKKKTIGITRAHLEEDAGKSLHEDFHGMTGIDLNRAGTPLIEIVSEPDMRSATEAVAYLRSIHSLVQYLDICDGNMQEGSFRCDANVSIRPVGQQEYGTRTELKNINSFRFIEKAIEFEVERQIDILEAGGRVIQETRLYDSDKNETRSMRSKEEANDYRYFPDPDLPQMVLEDSFIDAIRAELPELPDARCARFISEYELSDYDAKTLTASKQLADYYEQAVAALPSQPKLIANWVSGELSAGLNRNTINITECPVTAAMLGQLVTRIDDNTISGKIAKEVFEAIWGGEGSADEIIEKRGLKQISDDSAIEPVIDEILANNPNQIEQYKAGNSKLLGFFVGQVMKATHGKANPKQVNELLRKKLGA